MWADGIIENLKLTGTRAALLMPDQNGIKFQTLRIIFTEISRDTPLFLIWAESLIIMIFEKVSDFQKLLLHHIQHWYRHLQLLCRCTLTLQ